MEFQNHLSNEFTNILNNNPNSVKVAFKNNNNWMKQKVIHLKT